MRRSVHWFLFCLIVASAGIPSSQGTHCFGFENKEPRRAGRFSEKNSHALAAFGKAGRSKSSASHGQLISNSQIKVNPPDVDAEMELDHEQERHFFYSENKAVNPQRTAENYEYSVDVAKFNKVRRLLEESDSGSMSQGNNQETASGDIPKDKGETQDETKAESTIQDGKELNQQIESKGNEVGDSKVQGESTEDVKVQAEIKEPGGEKGQMQNQEEKVEENKEGGKGSEERRRNEVGDNKVQGESIEDVKAQVEIKEPGGEKGQAQNQEEKVEDNKQEGKGSEERKGNEVGDSKVQGERTEDVTVQAEIKEPGGEKGQVQNQEEKVEDNKQEGKGSEENRGNEVGDSKVQGESTEDVKVQAEIKEPGGEKGQVQNQEEKVEENKQERKGSEERKQNGGVDDKKQGNLGDAVQVVQETKESEDKIGSGRNQEQNQEQIKKDDTNEQKQASGSGQSDSQEQSHKQEDIKQDEIKTEEKAHEAETQKLLEEIEHKSKADSKNEEHMEEQKVEDNKEHADKQRNYVATPTEETMEKKDDIKVQEETVKEPEVSSQHKDDEIKVEDKKQEADQQNSSVVTLAEEKVQSPSSLDAPKGPEVGEKEDMKVQQQQAEDKVDESQIESEKIENKEVGSETREQEVKHESQSKIDQLQSSEHVTEETQNSANPENSLEDKRDEPTASNESNNKEKADLDSDQKQPEVQVDGQQHKEEKVEENPGNMETKKQDSSDADLKLDDPGDFHGSEENPQVEASNSGNKGEAGLGLSAELANDDDYHDIVQEFSNLPSKFHETAGHVAQKLLPELEKISNKSKDYFLLANQHMTKRFLPLIGEQYAPLAASLICYGLLLLPLALVVFLVERIRAIFSLQKVLLIANIYLAAYFVSLVLAFFLIGTEPILFVVQNSPSNFIMVQLLQGAGYILYLILQTANFVTTCSDGAILAKLSTSIQWLVATIVGLHYYVTVFHRVMAQRLPETSWKANAIYSSTFVVFCFFARIKRGKKEYIRIGDDTTDKKN